jgi:GMP synthase (glutamine-hydrolysing)
MRLHYLQHISFEDPSHIAVWAGQKGFSVTGTHLYKNPRFPLIDSFDILVVMGGPMNVYEYAAYPWLLPEKELIANAIAADKKVLGICLGAQLIASALGARVFKNTHKEIGWFPVSLTPGARRFGFLKQLNSGFPAFHWHGDTFDVPSGAVRIAKSKACANQGFVYKNNCLALQFHLESTPESIDRLIDHCGEELIVGKYVQGREALKEHCQELTRTTRKALESILDRWVAG